MANMGNSKYIETIREDTMTLPFHVINKAGFGVHLPWPTWKRAKDPFIHATGVDEIGPGHVMSYRQALQSAITHLFHILIFPDWILRKYTLLDSSLVQAGSDIMQDSYHLVMPNCCARADASAVTFAQVELLAVLAVLLKSYTLEIDVEDFVDDEAIKLMSAEQKGDVWMKAAAKSKFVLRQGMRHHLTMQHKEGKIALRLVKRGEERFA
jgi:hypothetical protein